MSNNQPLECDRTNREYVLNPGTVKEIMKLDSIAYHCQLRVASADFAASSYDSDVMELRKLHLVDPDLLGTIR